jgi:hypothetical protein
MENAVLSKKLALIVWLELTFVNVYELTEPTDEPSTTTFKITYPVFGVMVNV